MGTGGVGFFQIRLRSGGVGGPKNTKATFFCTNVMNGIRYFISANTALAKILVFFEFISEHSLTQIMISEFLKTSFQNI